MKYLYSLITLLFLGFTFYASAVPDIWSSNRGYGIFPRGDGQPWTEQRNQTDWDRENTYDNQRNTVYPNYYPNYYPSYYPSYNPGYDPFPDATRADQLYEENLRR